MPEQTVKFFNQFEETRSLWHTKLHGIRKNGDKVAVFGAGHLATKFINFFELENLIDCVVDDHPEKVGLHMPGSGLPIIPSSKIKEYGIRYCVSTLSPESEVKVRKKIQDYFENGGHFLPAF
jgi:hypothetical protein